MDSTYRSMEELDEEVRRCRRCRLSNSRRNAVPGEGARGARMMFIGEGPGEQEDGSGRPFVGRAGKLLDEALKEAGLRREDVYITNIVKCRPPGNRRPMDDEMDQCSSFLESQIALVKPDLTCLLGATALQRLVGDKSISGSRGKMVTRFGKRFFPTFHPAAALRDPKIKVILFRDIKEIVRLIKSREVYGRDPEYATLG